MSGVLRTEPHFGLNPVDRFKELELMNIAAELENSGGAQLLLYVGVRELLLEAESSSAHLRSQSTYCVAL